MAVVHADFIFCRLCASRTSDRTRLSLLYLIFSRYHDGTAAADESLRMPDYCSSSPWGEVIYRIRGGLTLRLKFHAVRIALTSFPLGSPEDFLGVAAFDSLELAPLPLAVCDAGSEVHKALQ